MRELAVGGDLKLYLGNKAEALSQRQVGSCPFCAKALALGQGRKVEYLIQPGTGDVIGVVPLIPEASHAGDPTRFSPPKADP